MYHQHAVTLVSTSIEPSSIGYEASADYISAEGPPYASHDDLRECNKRPLSDEEKRLCKALGKRVASAAIK